MYFLSKHIDRTLLSRTTLTCISMLMLMYTLLALYLDLIYLNDYFLNNSIEMYESHRSENTETKVAVLVAVFGTLLDLRYPFSKKDKAYNEVCEQFGRLLIIFGVIMTLFSLVINASKKIIVFSIHLTSLGLFIWPVVNIFLAILLILFIYYSFNHDI